MNSSERKAVMSSEVLKSKRIAKHIDHLLKQYAKDLERSNESDYAGSFHVFEGDESLWGLLFSTEYARDFLDYNFFSEALYQSVVVLELKTGKEICEYLLWCIGEFEKDRDSIAIFPVAFTGAPMSSRCKGDLKFGRYLLLEPQETVEELSSKLKAQLNSCLVDREGHEIYVAERFSGGALARCSLLTFEVSGTEDNRNYSSVQKFEYFRRVFEVFAVYSGNDTYLVRAGLKDINHAFFVRKRLGAMDFYPLQSSSRIGPEITARLYDFLLQNKFELFVNRVFYSEDKIFGRIQSALYFFSKGFNGSDYVMGFLSYVISMECLFARENMSGIKDTLARYISNLCCEELEQKEVDSLVRKIYKQRSQIVHSGRFDLREGLRDKAKMLSARVIFACFELHAALLQETSKKSLEERYFERLNEFD